MKLQLLFTLLLCSFLSFAQNPSDNGTLSGKVVDSQTKNQFLILTLP